MNRSIENTIEKTSKEVAMYFIDKMIIGSKFDNEEVKELLRKNKVITRATKTIRVIFNKIEDRTWRSGRAEYLGTYFYSLSVKNGNGKTLISISFKTEEIPEILEGLK